MAISISAGWSATSRWLPKAAPTPVVVLNKTDLCDRRSPRAMAETAAVAGHRARRRRAHAEPRGHRRRSRPYLADGRTVALLGSSGVGKSTLVNCLLGEERLRTAEVRESDSRGRHTTTHRELIPLPGGGALIDTPGMRELQLWAGGDAVDRPSTRSRALAAGCRFRDCAHPASRVRRAGGAYEHGEVAGRERLASYRKLAARGAAPRGRMADPLLALERKRKWKKIHSPSRRVYKSRTMTTMSCHDRQPTG